MTWSDLTTNLRHYAQTLRSRFPHVESESLRFIDSDEKLIDYVARSHDLTQFEAREELEDLIFVESLARQSADLRAV